jgi:hypothetical protein
MLNSGLFLDPWTIKDLLSVLSAAHAAQLSYFFTLVAANQLLWATLPNR